MGYYTDYDFSNNSEEIIKAVEDVTEYGHSYGGWYGAVKWYSHEEDMLKVSKMFPDALITLEGVGEDFPDVWRAYFKNGRFYKVKATFEFEDFDESKLKGSK